MLVYIILPVTLLIEKSLKVLNLKKNYVGLFHDAKERKKRVLEK